ncbi:hypothetical protein Tco_0728309 [Tanacetum coccineum]|uniref:Uncharacterized protein n=1 Tax=Tanacetum coccineum TaxID=301880 RepID=A0ABQ4YP05_9ASTR
MLLGKVSAALLSFGDKTVCGLSFEDSLLLVADETVHEERGDSVERATTTATSLDAEQGSGRLVPGAQEHHGRIEPTQIGLKRSRMIKFFYKRVLGGVHEDASVYERGAGMNWTKHEGDVMVSRGMLKDLGECANNYYVGAISLQAELVEEAGIEMRKEKKEATLKLQVRKLHKERSRAVERIVKLTEQVMKTDGSSKRDAEEELDQESSKRKKTIESSELAEEPRVKEADELFTLKALGSTERSSKLGNHTKKKFQSTESTDDKKEIYGLSFEEIIEQMHR